MQIDGLDHRPIGFFWNLVWVHGGRSLYHASGTWRIRSDMLCIEPYRRCFVYWSDGTATVTDANGAELPRVPFRVTAMGLRGLYRLY